MGTFELTWKVHPKEAKNSENRKNLKNKKKCTSAQASSSRTCNLAWVFYLIFFLFFFSEFICFFFSFKSLFAPAQIWVGLHGQTRNQFDKSLTTKAIPSKADKNVKSPLKHLKHP